VPIIQYYNALAVSLGTAQPGNRLQLAASDADRQAAGDLLAQAHYESARPLVMLNPGAAFGPSKLWPAQKYAQLADELAERRGCQIIINAAPAERDVAAAVASTMKSPPLISFADRANSIGLLKGLIARCDLLVTNDTGARHLAAGLGRAVVTIFGSTDETWARLDYPLERTVRAAVPCGPCQSKLCTLPPDSQDFHQCMKLVTVESVLLASMELLDAGGPEVRP
jgi:heptosyltransferase-2